MKQKIFGQIMKDRATFTKRVWISCLHELRSPELTDAENQEVFGQCFRTHGHDYGIEVTVAGQIDEKTGLLCDRERFETILDNEFVKKFDKTHLNHAFKNTTGELLALEFFLLLKNKLKNFDLVKVGVQETPKNYFSYTEG